jgi:hypothetical protein
MLVPNSNGIPVMISRDKDVKGNRYWDHPITRLETDDAVIAFLEYFDGTSSALLISGITLERLFRLLNIRI